MWFGWLLTASVFASSNGLHVHSRLETVPVLRLEWILSFCDYKRYRYSVCGVNCHYYIESCGRVSIPFFFIKLRFSSVDVGGYPAPLFEAWGSLRTWIDCL